MALTAAPAAADAAGPSDFRSEVTGIDAGRRRGPRRDPGRRHFLELRRRGPRGDRPGLQRASRTCASARTGPWSATATAPPPTSTTTARGRAPSRRRPRTPTPSRCGRRSASGGTYAWHDHRVHWMSEVSPPVDRGEQVPGRLRPVEGADRGRRHRRRGAGHPHLRDGHLARSRGSPLGVVAAGAPGLVRPAPGGARRGADALAVASVLAVVVGRADFSAGPGGNPLLWGLPVVGARRRRSPRWCPGCGAVAVIGSLAVGGLPVRLGAAPVRRPHQAGAADRRSPSGSTGPRPPAASASASRPPTSPSPAASSSSPRCPTTDDGYSQPTFLKRR